MNNFIKHNWLAVVAILMLGGILGSNFSGQYVLPLAFYQLMNWVVVGTASMVAFEASKQGNVTVMWPFILLAVIFNQVAPLYFTPTIWQGADIVAILLFIASFFVLKPKN